VELGMLCAGAGLGLVLVMLLGLLKQFVFVGRPNELLIFSGRQHKDGVGYRVVHGGFFRVPLLEKVDRMDLTTIPIELSVANAYSKGGIPLTVHAVANVKVSSAPGHPQRHRAVPRPRLGEIRQVAKESLEGHLRGIIAR
jgi:flotillin